jgi:hypothetical protein
MPARRWCGASSPAPSDPRRRAHDCDARPTQPRA